MQTRTDCAHPVCLPLTYAMIGPWSPTTYRLPPSHVRVSQYEEIKDYFSCTANKIPRWISDRWIPEEWAWLVPQLPPDKHAELSGPRASPESVAAALREDLRQIIDQLAPHCPLLDRIWAPVDVIDGPLAWSPAPEGAGGVPGAGSAGAAGGASA